MHRRDVSRRRLLGGMTAVGVGGFAGCLDRFPFLGGGGFEPAKWMHHRGAVYESRPTYYATLARPADVPDVGDVAGFYDYLTHANLFGIFAGVDWQSATGTVAFRQSNVLRADYDRSSVVGTLTGKEPEFQAAGSYRGYDIYENEQVGMAMGLDSNTLVAGHAFPDLEATQALETTVDAREGDVPRLVDGDEVADLLLDRVADRGIAEVKVWTESPFDGSESDDALVGWTGWASEFDVGRETTDVRKYYVYEDASQVDADAFRQMIEDSENEGLYEVRDRSLSTDGRVLTATGITDTDELGRPFG